MGKLGCRLYCWGCGGCCVITGIVMGILAGMIPPSMVHSLQEGLFDLSYIDDTSQTEAEGLLADADLAIAESDAFKAWGKAFSDGFNDCMKADFAFDWDKIPEYCVDGLHPTFYQWNITNPGTWGDFGTKGFEVLQLQELAGFTVYKDSKKIDADTAYWDESGKARFRFADSYAASAKISAAGEAMSNLKAVVTLNLWYGIFASLSLADGWELSHAVAASPTAGHPATLNAYLAATGTIPMDAHSAIPLPSRTAARMIDLVTFIYTPNAPTMGKTALGLGEYATLRQYLWNLGGTYLTSMAPKFMVPAVIMPALIKISSNGILGWGEGGNVVWMDPISNAAFTFDFCGGANAGGRPMYYGQSPTAYIEEKMSSVFYHEGLGYVTHHYETFTSAKTNSHSCAWDPDCPADCTIEGTANCQPLKAQGYDGGKIPGLYFYSPKGAPGFAAYAGFYTTYYLAFTMKSAGRVVLPVSFFKPDAKEYDPPAFEGHLTHSAFSIASYLRRLENCNYPGGRDLGGGVKDSLGIDCGGVKDTSPLAPYFGLPLYWMLMIRNGVPPGWDPATTNAEDGAGSTSMSAHATVTSCLGNQFCSDALINSKGPAFTTFLTFGYEPHLGALIDFHLAGGLGWKWSASPRHPHLMGAYRFVPLFWIWNYLHLPTSINMDLAKLQGVPAAMNGFWSFLIVQCMLSLIGGITCCFCGV